MFGRSKEERIKLNTDRNIIYGGSLFIISLHFIKMLVAHNLRLLAFLMPDEVSVCQKT
jgi:hypothetical protein